ncbi:MAG: glycerophosphodiester phosphodiesterase [Gaiellales bacterium]
MTWVIAHRGASADEKENTLRAFERALAMGCDYVELDVQASVDGELIVFHDTRLDRLTPLRGPVGRRRAAELAEHEIPTLAQVVELIRGRAGIMAELKSPHLYRRHELVSRTLALLDDAADVVLSFQRPPLEEARRLRPQLRILQHVGFGVSIRRAAGYASLVGFDNPRVTARGLARARALGLGTAVYTVNDERRMRKLVALGVDGIFSDRPDVLRRVVSRA